MSIPSDTVATPLLDGSEADAIDRLRQLDAVAAVGRVASSLSHALGTPLNVIAGRASLLSLVAEGNPEVQKNSAIIQEQVKHVTALIGNVLNFARSDWPLGPPTQLRSLVERISELGTPFADAHGIHIDILDVDEVEVRVPNDRVLHVLMTLLALATRTAERGSRFLLDARMGSFEPPPQERGRVIGTRFARFGIQGPFVLHDQALENVYEPWLVSGGIARETVTQLAVAFGVTREHQGWMQFARNPAGLRLDAHFPLG